MPERMARLEEKTEAMQDWQDHYGRVIDDIHRGFRVFIIIAKIVAAIAAFGASMLAMLKGFK